MQSILSSTWGLILGGSSGIGLASAKKLAAHGMNLCILHRDRRANLPSIDLHFDELREYPIELLTFNVNALDKDQRNHIVLKLKKYMNGSIRLNLVLHCIAKGNLKPLWDPPSPNLTSKDYHLTLEAMATSLWDWADELLQANLLTNPTSIIGLTSEGNHKVWPGYGAVSAAKATLEAIIRQMAVELGPFGIRANAIQAGITDTPSLRLIPNSEQMLQIASERNPLKRITTPEDIANVIFLLCLPESQWINGAVIPVDGGERLQ